MDSENEEEREVLNLTQTISAIDQQQIEMRNKIKQLKQELKDSEQNKKSMTQRISMLGKKNRNRYSNSNQNNDNNQNAPNSLDHILSKELRAFKLRSFRPMQKEIISEFLSGLDCFVIMRSGGGKSLCYQLPALISNGTAIIVSPLIALMKNQVDTLRGLTRENNIAHVLNSSLSKKEIDNVKNDIINLKTKLLYVAPESLIKKENIDFLKCVNISFFERLYLLLYQICKKKENENTYYFI